MCTYELLKNKTLTITGKQYNMIVSITKANSLTIFTNPLDYKLEIEDKIME